MKMKHILLTILAIVPLTFVAACVSDDAMSQAVIVKQEDLKTGTVLTPGPTQEAAPVQVDKLPKALQEVVKKALPDATIVVVTTMEHVKPGVPGVMDDPKTTDIDEYKPAIPAPQVIPVTAPPNAEGKPDFWAVAGQLVPAAEALLPPGVREAILPIGYALALLLKKRPRGHIADVISNLNPLDGGTVDVKAAYSSAKKAIGLEHSLEEPEQLRAVADKIELEKTHDAIIKS